MKTLLTAIASILITVMILCLVAFAIDSKVVVFWANITAGEGLELFRDEGLTMPVGDAADLNAEDADGIIRRGGGLFYSLFIVNTTDQDLNIYYSYFSEVADIQIVVEDQDDLIAENNITIQEYETYLLPAGEMTDGWIDFKFHFNAKLGLNPISIKVHGE